MERMAYPLPSIDDLPIDHHRPIRVICIGAGISGILTGIRFPQKIKNLDLTIYEKNEGLGGTWFENRYPGIACDIPSHSYSFTFENNPNWSRLYSSGSEILEYLNHVADKYGVRKYIKFGHLFQSARWLADVGKWQIEMLRLSDNQTFIDTADVLVKGTGILNSWKWPQIEGLHDFSGLLLHSANYDTSSDLVDKRVAIIGNGSTGIQIAPAIHPIAKNVNMYIRSKSWVSPRGPFSSEVEKRGGDENFEYPHDEKTNFKDHPEALKEYRRSIEEVLHKGYLRIFRESESRKEAALVLEQLVKEKLKSKPGLFKTIRPEWPVGCKRLGASPGYLESITEDNVEVITTGIKKVTSTGILEKDGTLREVDAIICATGFDTSLSMANTPIYGQDGLSLDDIWTPEPEAYLSICPVKMPNFFIYLGPNGAPNSTMIVMIEFQCEYMIKCIQKLQREHIKSMVPTIKAKDDFVRYSDKFFLKTVLTEDCASWFKSRGEKDGRITAMWPGSLPHAWKAYEHPRWEDFEYERLPEVEDNALAWLGNGTTMAQQEGTPTTGYLDIIDNPPINPDWQGSKTFKQ